MAAALSRGDVAKAHIWRQLGRVSEGAAVAGYRWLRCRQFRFSIVNALKPSSRLRHRLLHGRHELAQRERLGQEVELLAFGQALLERVFRVAGDEDELDVGV